ncbi:glutathione S-transferase family protein [Planctobacterium marinum]|uniref:glutathione S-transferase family protein n=1 Tax=Planctobacterium marinum TaxID=1631968 RepID=UPI001E3FA404|nr:glutathione S-transferase [Planctobacterium marinum]MCC2604629.1 glutathione S-transferase [Planctobacterium marinum]
MYTLYYVPDSCSLATHTILKLLGQTPRLKSAKSLSDYETVNPTKMVPALATGERLYTEGAAIILHLLDNHPNPLMPVSGEARQTAIEYMMLANASMHPAYSRLFFAANHIQDEQVRLEFFNAAAQAINQLWQVVEAKLGEGPYLRGTELSPADVLLAVYSRWGQFFPVDIRIGEKAQRMIQQVLEHDAFQTALAEQNKDAESVG